MTFITGIPQGLFLAAKVFLLHNKDLLKNLLKVDGSVTDYIHLF